MPNSPGPQPSAWEGELRQALRTADDLVKAGFIASTQAKALTPVLEKYKFVLPRYYANLIDRSDPNCPIRLQALPLEEELREDAISSGDPLKDLEHRESVRVTHRYSKRLLLHLTPNCSMYCRFCFRKTLLNEEVEGLFRGSLDEALSYIRRTSQVEEVIFSGGDPFLAKDSLIQEVLGELEKIPSVSRVRFHTRVPVTFPCRITEELCELFKSATLPVVVVTHFNHPKEITKETKEAARKLKETGVTLLNQSVLLARVNDSSRTLATLSRALFEMGILPYYLHHTDPAKGTSHFKVSMEKGLLIYDELRAELAGYLVPRYVVDEVGFPFKRTVSEALLDSKLLFAQSFDLNHH